LPMNCPTFVFAIVVWFLISKANFDPSFIFIFIFFMKLLI
jgi:hypothetical protein